MLRGEGLTVVRGFTGVNDFDYRVRFGFGFRFGLRVRFRFGSRVFGLVAGAVPVLFRIVLRQISGSLFAGNCEEHSYAANRRQKSIEFMHYQSNVNPFAKIGNITIRSGRSARNRDKNHIFTENAIRMR